jgi:cytochrome P450
MLSLLLDVLFVLSAILVLYRMLSRKTRSLPPGPRGWPILGNMLELRGDLPVWHVFDRLKNQYGPIVYLNFAGQDVVLLNTKEVATELLDHRSFNYSDRPKITVADYLGGPYTMALTRYGKTWQSLRRASHSVLNIRASMDYCPAQADEAIILAFDLLNKSAPPLKSIQRCSASTVVSMCYGMPPLISNDPILQKLDDIVRRFIVALSPGAFLVEFFPFLDYCPPFLAKWKRDAQEDFKKSTGFFENHFEQALQLGEQKKNLSANLAEDQAANGLSLLESAWLVGTLYFAGFETTSTSLAWLLHVLSLNPLIQRKAQEEIDHVVGQSRTPTFTDMERLPYIRAIVKEILRLQPALPLGIPHASFEDDWYEGYFIPKGTICFSNVWSINRSTDSYGLDALEFRPERFLNSDGTLKNDIEDGHSSFGFGRRVCVGRHIADNALLIDIATILWALDIVPTGQTHQGKPLRSQKGNVNTSPEIQCNFVPRFPEVEGILKNMRDDLTHSW